MPGDLIPCSLFLIGILTSVAADCRLRRAEAAPWANRSRGARSAPPANVWRRTGIGTSIPIT
ncbi:hypothetical protein FV228_29060, partial [Methylobacterium sp. WL18]